MTVASSSQSPGRYLALRFPYLPTDRIRRERRRMKADACSPSAGRPDGDAPLAPLALFAEVSGALRLCALCPGAEALGLAPGLGVAEARARHPGLPVRWITADLFDLAPGERFDAAICALFTHHLDDATLVRFLRSMAARARLGWFISDLHRHPLPWATVWAGVRLLRMDPMVVHDSTVSIARGFSRSDWEGLIGRAGVAAELRWAFPFRWAVSGPGRAA